MYRYSERLAWTDQVNTISALITEQRASGRRLFDLTVSNPTEALSAYPHGDIAAALGSVEDFSYRPHPFGDVATRDNIVRRLEKQFPGIRCSSAHVALTASTSEAYSLLFKLLANPGEEMLVPLPSYPLFELLAKLDCVKLSPYRTGYDGSWFLDFQSMEEAVSAATRAVILVNPNNPTGSFLKAAEWERLQEFALRHSLPLICDEVFMNYGFGDAKDRVLTIAGRNTVLSFSLNGLSKSAGMPQMKLGWITVSGPHVERERACSRLELLLDTYLSVGTPVQRASERLFSVGDQIQAQIRRRIEANLFRLTQMLEDSVVHCLHLEGGWSAILRVPHFMSEDQWATRLLVEHGVIVQPGYFFDMPEGPFLVVSLLPDERVFGSGIEKILVLAKGLS